MLTYIYFVKCPGCEDEPFDFFNEAKDFALNCLSKKPIITQVEVNRNDFGECTDSADLGTVWSWEEMMKTDDEPAKCVFTKDDLKCNDCDAEFDALDNSLDSAPEDFRKPVPADMAIEDLVEEMEENEDTVECKWCNELFDKSECRYEVDMGWLCDRCQAAIKSRGETLTFREGPIEEAAKRDPFDHHDPDYDEEEAADALADLIDLANDAKYDRILDEAVDPSDLVELEYPSLTVTLYGPQRDVDDWDEVEHTTSHVFSVPKVDVATAIWENWITEEDVKDVEGGLDTLEDDIAWEKFLETHFDDLFEKYNKQILEYFKEEAAEDFRERSQEEYDMERWSSSAKRVYDPFLEELEEATDYRKHLVDCPECGAGQSFDHGTGICINCGFNV